MQRITRLVLASLSAVVLTSGCGGSGTAPITKQEEDMMRRPVGQTPMPPEAARAMQRARQGAAQGGGAGR